MKKIYILFLLLFCFLLINAQTIISYNFETGLPSGWIAQTGWKVGNISTLKSDYFPFTGNNTKFVGINDDKAGQTGNSNGKLITDYIDFTQNSEVLLKMDLYFYNGNYSNKGQETFNIFYSEDGSIWNLIDKVEETYIWNKYYFGVSKEIGGKKVKLAFEYKDGSNWNFGVGVDNIVFEVQPNYVFTLNPPTSLIKKVTEPDQEVNYDFVLNSFGKLPVSNFKLNYQIDNSDIKEILGQSTLNTNDSYIFSIPGFKVGKHTIKSKFIANDTINLIIDTVNVEIITPIPQFHEKDIDNVDHSIHNDLEAGKAVLIDFFASWCSPCQGSTPIINKVWERYGSGKDKFEIYGLSIESQDDANVLKGLNWGGKYPKFAYNDRNEFYWNIFNTLYGEGSIPFFVFICPNTLNPGFSEVTWTFLGNQPSLESDLTIAVQNCVGSPSIVSPIEVENLSIYPNPVSDLIHITFSLDGKMNTKIYITDINGKKVKSVSETIVDNFCKISSNITELKSGTYFLNISNEKGHKIQKFVKL